MTNEGKARGFINRLIELDIIIGTEEQTKIAVTGLTQLLDHVQKSTLREIEDLGKLGIYNL